jgi:outer membrane biogenesis lipoprotein LolB
VNFKYALIFLLAFLLSACASLNDPFEIFKSHPPSIEISQVSDENQFIEEFSIKAKFAYSIDSKGGSGRLIWRYENNQDEIDIFSPFNTQIAKIIYSAQEKKIIDAHGKILSDDDFDHYIQTLFGKNISPDLFRHLITNHVELIKDLRREDNQFNRATHFYNDEWDIVINAFKTQDKLTIPSKISISQGTFNFNFIVEEIINIAGK